MQHNELPASLRAELAGEKPANALPDKWVRALFARLEIRYGDGWSRKWAAIPDMALVHADWARQLAGTSGEAIAHALRHLPDDAPPTVGQFRALCRRYVPESDLAQLEWTPQPLTGPVAEKVSDFMQAMRRKTRQAGGDVA